VVCIPALKSAIEQRLLWLSHWMIHNANHIRPKADGIKVGGHQASGVGLDGVDHDGALFLGAAARGPGGGQAARLAGLPRDAVPDGQPDAGEDGELPRALAACSPIPARTKDIDDVDFSTGSVGLGVAITSFASLVQDFIKAKEWGEDRAAGRMVALVGDAELDEGNIYETLQEGWKNDLRNCWWIIDYNRQSLDGVVREGLFKPHREDLRHLRLGRGDRQIRRLQRAAFAEPGGDKLREWIDNCPNQLYSALTFMGGAVWRKHLMDDLGDQGDVTALIERAATTNWPTLMENLGGNCVETMAETFRAIDHDRPTCFLAYTIKGWGTPIAGHKDNHGGLMTKAQMAEWQRHMGVPEGEEWDRSPPCRTGRASGVPGIGCRSSPRAAALRRPALPCRHRRCADDREISTQAAFGKILDDLPADDSELAARIVTTSPDVTGTTNLWAPGSTGASCLPAEALPTCSSAEHSLDRQMGVHTGRPAPRARHRGNEPVPAARRGRPVAFAVRQAAHPDRHRLRPVRARGLDALNYACYQDARFMIVGTPSGVTLAPEGGAHQSIGSPLIGMSQDGLAAFEPAFADELAVIMEWAFDYMQRDGEGDPDERTWLRDETGGSVYLRLTTNPIEQPGKRADDDFRQGRSTAPTGCGSPGPNCEVVIAYQGVVAPEAIRAAGIIARAGAMSACWPSPPPTGSTPAGRRHSARGPGATPQPAISRRCWAPCPALQDCHRHRRPSRQRWHGHQTMARPDRNDRWPATRRAFPLGVGAFRPDRHHRRSE
jgi:pyruvate dehydrogenase E1 component